MANQNEAEIEAVQNIDQVRLGRLQLSFCTHVRQILQLFLLEYLYVKLRLEAVFSERVGFGLIFTEELCRKSNAHISLILTPQNLHVCLSL